MPAHYRLSISLILFLGFAAGTPIQADASGQDITDEIFYHFMPIAWRDSDSDAFRFGDFGGMTASLDYLAGLGVTAIWMNPIQPSPAYHGYQHGDGDDLNAWFGTESDLTTFLTAAHARGIRVFVDFVAYGVSHNEAYFTDAFGNPSSIYDSWLAFENPSNTAYLGSMYTTWNGSTVGFIHWDLRNPTVSGLVQGWMAKWLDPNTDGDFSDGLDGYRLDHVWVDYPNGPDGWGYNLDDFWVPTRTALRAVNPDMVLFAEQANWGIHGEELFEGLDGAFTKPFEFAARSALGSGSAAALRGEMAATVAALRSAPGPGNFLCTIGNHDVDRLATAIGSSFERGKAAAAVLLTQPFPPVIYYGDEIGMRGAKDFGLGGDAADIPMREPFKWNAVAGPPMSNFFALHGPAFTNRISRDNDGRSVEEQNGVTGSLLETYRGLIAARAGSVALRRGEYYEAPISGNGVWSFVRHHADQQVLVAINVSGVGVGENLDLSSFGIPGGSTTPLDLLTGATYPALTDANKGVYPLSLPPFGFVLLEVGVEAPAPPVNVVDGRDISDDFGAAYLFATQDNPTNLGNNVNELNQLYMKTESDALLIGITGNLNDFGVGLSLLFDTRVGGQNLLDMTGAFPPPHGPDQFTGMLLDPGFLADHLIYVNAFNGDVFVDQFQLLTGGGISKTYRGQGTVNDGDGFLSGGSNPGGMQTALDDTNVDGITDTDVSLAHTATTGVEISIPFSYLDVPAGPTTVRLACFINEFDGTVSNQWLPGLGGGYSSLGVAPDLTDVPGSQFIEIELPLSSSGTPPDGDPVLPGLSFPNPSRGGLAFSFDLEAQADGALRIFDGRGRLVRTVHRGLLSEGRNEIAWDGRGESGRTVAAGIYFVEMEAGGLTRRARIVRLP